MRVSKNQLIQGIGTYLKEEILPKMDQDRAAQIIASIAINAAMENSRILDAVFTNDILLALLDDDGSGTYDIDGLVSAIRDAVEAYGSFPVKCPNIPLISTKDITLRLDAADVDAMRRRVEAAEQ